MIIRASCIAALILVGSCTPHPTGPVMSAWSAPTSIATLDHGTTHDLPGVANVLVLDPGLISGAQPRAEEGFATLASLGVRSIISVDGAPPNAQAAAAHGIRTVHIPVGYAGVSTEQQTRLAVAIRDLDGPVFVHCHHGMHRGPAAAALALLLTGRIDREQAIVAMRTAGTSDAYPGLYRAVENSEPLGADALASLDEELSERVAPSSVASAMIEIDRAFERLTLLQENGWAATPEHPDLAPAPLAAAIDGQLRALAALDHPDRDDPVAFATALLESAEFAKALESALDGSSSRSPDRSIDRLASACNACHASNRDGRSW